MAAQSYFLCVRKVIQLQVPISHVKGKLVNCEHCFEKGSCPKENFLHKRGYFYTKGLPNVTFYAYKRSFNCRYQYHTRKENQSIASIVLKNVHAQKKIFCIKRDFLHKRAAQCYFLCVQKVIQLQVLISHVKKKLVNYGHCFGKGSCLKEIFCMKGLPNVTFFACKRSFNCKYPYHTERKNQSTASIVFKKVYALKKIFCMKRDFSA